MVRLLRPHDPDLVSLRRAARVTLVAPAAFALGAVVLDDIDAGLFALFGSFAPLVFADFTGPARSRAGAYLATAIAGAVLIVAGTALSGDLVAAAVAAFVIGFAIRFTGVFGGHVEAAGVTLILAFVLAATVEAPFADIGSRLLGWLGAGALVAIGSVVLWPHYQRARLLRAAGAACRALAVAVREPERTAEAGTVVEGFRAEVARAPYRPAGPSEHDRAYLMLVDQLVRVGAFLPVPADGDDDRALAVAMASAMEATAAQLREGAEGADLAELERVRRAHREALSATAGSALREGARADAVLDHLDASFRLRVASFLALSLAANARLLGGETIPATDEFEVRPEVPVESGVADVVLIGARRLRSHLTRSSPRLHDAVRGAAGLAIATFVAIAADVGHGFWVVLGTLAVLRSNALGTGRTAVQAILGTTAGFVVGSVLILAIGTGTAALWIALPVTAFLAAYAPTAIHFVVGQAGFTIFVVVAFNIIDPVGWEVGLVRIEDVAIGATVSLVVGLLLWPRGGRAALREQSASAYRIGARYVADGFALSLRGEAGDRASADRTALVAASARLSEALRQHLGEPGTHLGIETWGAVLAAPRHMRAIGDSLGYLVELYGKPTRPAGGPGYAAAIGSVTEYCQALATILDRGVGDRGPTGALEPPGDPGEATRGEATAALEAWGGSPDDPYGSTALLLVWARDWLRALARIVRDLPQPTAEVAAKASQPWWRV